MEDKDKQILVFNCYFWPGLEATGLFLTELCEQLAKIYKVTVITGRSHYTKDDGFGHGKIYRRQMYKGINILRVRHTKFWKRSVCARMINWFTYCVLASIAAISIRPKLIIVGTDPPFLGIIAMIISRLKSVPFIYNCRDLYPDVVLELGILKRGLRSYIYDCLNRKALYAAKVVVTIGISMEDRLKSKGVAGERIRVIPDWVDTAKIRPVPKNDNPLLEQFKLKNKFIIMYSGNLGLSQDFSSILQALTMINEPVPFSLVFIGEGAAKEDLKANISSLGIKNVLFLPYQPQDLLSFSLSMADLHLVPLKKGVSGTIVPSKVYGVMAAARPYLAITDRKSEPARLAQEYGCGLWVAAGDTRAIAKTLSWVLNHPAELEKMGNLGRHIAETRFDKQVVIKEWFELLASFD